MAQPRVTDFFSSRKRNLDVQPSKRRKVVVDDAVLSATKPTDKRIRSRTSTRVKTNTSKSVSACLLKQAKSKQSTQSLAPQLDSSVETTQTVELSNTASKELASTEKCKASDCFLPVNPKDVVVLGDNGDIASKDVVESMSTAACDDHSASPSSTPTKRRVKNQTVTVSTKRSRVTKTTRRDLMSSLNDVTAEASQKEGFNFEPFTQLHDKKAICDEVTVEALVTSSRKKLQPHRPSGDSSDDGSNTKQSSPCKFIFRGSLSPKIPLTDKAPGATTSPRQELKETDTSATQEAKLNMAITKNVNSASANTPDERVQPATNKISPSCEEESRCTPQTSAINSSSPGPSSKTSTKEVLKLDVASCREKLAGCGQLSELKARLAEFGKAAKATKVRQTKKFIPKLTSPAKSEIIDIESPKKAPAYERFHSLASPVPPSLTLPYHYKVLDEMFRGVDTVVSMLHQRSELCTFNKLKCAVELMVRRTFDVKNLGRIKTVYPTAYKFRQEKGVPSCGGKTSGYQLTLEAILEHPQNEAPEMKVKSEKSKGPKKENFTAADLLDRKNTFHRHLIDIVKKHHKEFLAKLDRPLKVPEDKITRWHPKFQLDDVPAVEPAPLPLPPDVTTFTTAKDVLDQAKNKFTPRVQRALEIVSALSASNDKVAEKTETKPATLGKASNSSKNTLGGVPQSLLERIRAKEEKKLEHEMTRTPAQAKHIDTISRLPELVRILRTFFVTQKKVAIPVDDAVEKLSDSYKTSLGKAESERHLAVMVELLPEWIQLVTVKKGRFIKINKNHDVQQIYSKLQKILKQAS